MVKGTNSTSVKHPFDIFPFFSIDQTMSADDQEQLKKRTFRNGDNWIYDERKNAWTKNLTDYDGEKIRELIRSCDDRLHKHMNNLEDKHRAHLLTELNRNAEITTKLENLTRRLDDLTKRIATLECQPPPMEGGPEYQSALKEEKEFREDWKDEK